MLIGLTHLHRTLGYLVFLVALADLILALTKGRSDPGFAKVLRMSHNIGLLWCGRLTLLGGVVLAVLLRPEAAGMHFNHLYWLSVLLWGPIEVLGKRLVKPEVALAEDGGTASGRLIGGAVGQLLLLVAIVGLMSAIDPIVQSTP